MTDKDIIDTIAAHRIQTAWYGQHDGWWECTCQGGEFAIPWTPEHVLAALRSAGYAVVHAPAIQYKGLCDTDASLLRGAATRAEGGYPVGGSNVTRAVVKILLAVATAAEKAEEK